MEEGGTLGAPWPPGPPWLGAEGLLVIVWFEEETGEVPFIRGVGPTEEIKSVSDGPPDGRSVKIVESVGTENPVATVILGSKSEVKMEDRPEVIREVMGNVPFPEVV